MVNVVLAGKVTTLVVIDEAHEIARGDREDQRRENAREEEARPHERQLPRDHPLEPEEMMRSNLCMRSQLLWAGGSAELAVRARVARAKARPV